VVLHIPRFFKLVQRFIGFIIEFLDVKANSAKTGFEQQIFDFLTTP